MARKITHDDNFKLDGEELKSLLNTALEQAAKASEHTAEHGNILRGALDRWGLDRTAFTLVRRLYRMEEGRRQATLRDMIKLCQALGFFAQSDAFDDVLQDLVSALQGAHEPTVAA